jgi:hypothetical protein
MIQSTPIAGAVLHSALAGRFSDLITIRRGTGAVNSYNESVETFSDLAGHVDLPAVVAPGDIYAKMKRQETPTSQDTTEYEYLRVMLNGYYPLIQLTDHLEFDAFEWDIVAIDRDSTRSFTQILVQRITPGSV